MKKFLLIAISLFISVSFFAQVDSTKQSENEMVFVVEQQPEFIGGMMALKKYIDTNTTYTEKARKEKISGTVYISFNIETNGSITEPTVVRGLHPDLDSISILVVKNMPKWTPGMQKGKRVRCKYNIPIEFDLKKKRKRKK